MSAYYASSDDHAHLLTEIAKDLSALSGEADTVNAILERVDNLLPNTKHASLTVRHRNSLRTLKATSDTASAADQIQHGLREGPCLDQGEWSRSGDVANDHRWPRWGPTAAEIGIRSVLSSRLTARGEPFGALTMYSDRIGAFDDKDEVELALLFAVHAATALGSACQIAGLQAALTSRHDIGMAQGILIAKYGLDQETSFAALTRASSNTNTKLREIAAEVIRTGTVPGLWHSHD